MCTKEYSHQWYLKNKTRLQLIRKKWKAENPDYMKQYQKVYYENNKKEISAKRRKRYFEGEGQKKSKLYYEQNKEEIHNRMKKYYKNNHSIYVRNWRDYREKHIDSIRKNSREYNRRKRIKVLYYYGGNPPKCACCGENHIEFLSIDHMDGNGSQHRKALKIGAGIEFYGWLIRNNFPEGFQVLCHNCNIAKGKNKICPHQLETNSIYKIVNETLPIKREVQNATIIDGCI